MQNNTEEYLYNLRHSCAHLLAAAVMKLWPNTKRTIGPAIENGFYYDFDFEKPISEEDLSKIGAEMQKILKTWDKFEKEEVTKEEAKKRFKDNPYKLELIQEFSKDGKKITIYKSGDFEDLCKGGHTENPNKEIGAFKLLSLAGAYWRGSEKNKMLTRIYGTAFPTRKELDEYLQMLEEAKKRDHRKIGPQLELFMFHETAPGMAYWLPKGVVIYNELVNFWRKEHAKHGYQEIVTPLLNKKELYKTSGHWDHYLENMFVSSTEEKETYAAKPMNCPNAMNVFSLTTRSYKDLPLRLSETSVLHRFEPSGTLNGLFRAREFRQDDAHIFISSDQLETEFENLMKLVNILYSTFNLKYRLRFGTRPEGFMGNKKDWDIAEKSLQNVLDKSQREYVKEEGEGAFYGPKVDILMKDSLGREWQTGTIQLDFQLPKNFNLSFVNHEGKEKTPAVIHRAIYGSFERFLAILIEHFAGALPVWIAPTQVKILPISDKFISYANKVSKSLSEKGIRAEIDERNETLQAKIRDGSLEKVPYLLIVGAKEEGSGKVAPRTREGKDLGTMGLEEFTTKVARDIATKA